MSRLTLTGDGAAQWTGFAKKQLDRLRILARITGLNFINKKYVIGDVSISVQYILAAGNDISNIDIVAGISYTATMAVPNPIPFRSISISVTPDPTFVALVAPVFTATLSTPTFVFTPGSAGPPEVLSRYDYSYRVADPVIGLDSTGNYTGTDSVISTNQTNWPTTWPANLNGAGYDKLGWNNGTVSASANGYATFTESPQSITYGQRLAAYNTAYAAYLAAVNARNITKVSASDGVTLASEIQNIKTIGQSYTRYSPVTIWNSADYVPMFAIEGGVTNFNHNLSFTVPEDCIAPITETPPPYPGNIPAYIPVAYSYVDPPAHSAIDSFTRTGTFTDYSGAVVGTISGTHTLTNLSPNPSIETYNNFPPIASSGQTLTITNGTYQSGPGVFNDTRVYSTYDFSFYEAAAQAKYNAQYGPLALQWGLDWAAAVAVGKARRKAWRKKNSDTVIAALTAGGGFAGYSGWEAAIRANVLQAQGNTRDWNTLVKGMTFVVILIGSVKNDASLGIFPYTTDAVGVTQIEVYGRAVYTYDNTSNMFLFSRWSPLLDKDGNTVASRRASIPATTGPINNMMVVYQNPKWSDIQAAAKAQNTAQKDPNSTDYELRRAVTTALTTPA